MTQQSLEGWARAQGAGAGGARTYARYRLAQAAQRPLPERPARVLLGAPGPTAQLPRAEGGADPEGPGRFAVPLGGAGGGRVLSPPPPRRTVCLSSQAGCARGCVFCETG